MSEFKITVNPQSKTSIHEQITNAVLFAVASGRLAPGDALPAMRAVAESAGLNFNTVAKAYRDLSVLGVVVSRRGTPVVVADKGQKQADAVLAERLGDKLAECAREMAACGWPKNDAAQMFKDAYDGGGEVYV